MRAHQRERHWRRQGGGLTGLQPRLQRGGQAHQRFGIALGGRKQHGIDEALQVLHPSRRRARGLDLLQHLLQGAQAVAQGLQGPRADGAVPRRWPDALPGGFCPVALRLGQEQPLQAVHPGVGRGLVWRERHPRLHPMGAVQAPSHPRRRERLAHAGPFFGRKVASVGKGGHLQPRQPVVQGDASLAALQQGLDDGGHRMVLARLVADAVGDVSGVFCFKTTPDRMDEGHKGPHVGHHHQDVAGLQVGV